MPTNEDIVLRAVAVSNSLRARRGQEPIRAPEPHRGLFYRAVAAAKRLFGVK